MWALRVCLGLWLAVVGGLVATGGFLAFVRYATVLGLAGVLAGLGSVALAMAFFVWWPYSIRWSKNGCLVLHFLLRTERIPPTDVIWYKKRGVTWRLTSTGDQADADVFVIFRYRRPGRERPSIAFFTLAGTGPAFSRRGAEYETLLDKQIPERRR